MLKEALIAISITMSVGANIPLYRRIARRHHTRDFSKTSQLLIWLTQISQFMLAIAEHAPFLIGWYVLQIIFTGVTYWLVCRYWHEPNPVKRS